MHRSEGRLYSITCQGIHFAGECFQRSQRTATVRSQRSSGIWKNAAALSAKRHRTVGTRNHVRRLTRAPQIAAVTLALLMPERASAQALPGGVLGPGRLQTETGVLSIGTAASGIVKEILVHQGRSKGVATLARSEGTVKLISEAAARPRPRAPQTQKEI
jgi:hypothetical protein